MAETEEINLELANHAVKVDDWEFRPLIADLHLWTGRMVLEFKLEIGVPAIAAGRLRRSRLGQYRCGRNDLGLIDEITFNSRWLGKREYWCTLGTLLHELLHGWQFHHGVCGKRGYHNKQFRVKAWEYGLSVDSSGRTTYLDGDSAFRVLLRKYGVNVPEIPLKPEDPGRGKSKLQLWTCRCIPPVHLRVGREEIHVRCLDCGKNFHK